MEALTLLLAVTVFSKICAASVPGLVVIMTQKIVTFRGHVPNSYVRSHQGRTERHA
jgi:hypothetical protein